MTLTFVTNGDRWNALYLDGEMETQGHYADDPETVANVCINNEVDEYESYHISDKGEYPRAEFPDSLEEAREDDSWKLY
jgi:hypothetical protein